MRARLAVLAVLAVAGLIAMLGVTAHTASGAGHEAEVRITAQRLADGRTEFALQQREADGGWSDRLLPRVRFFPATVTAGRWLSSTPLAVRTPGAGADAEGTEVRITAQRLADGRTEFALQEREADGEWGERRLPQARFVPATSAVGRWLSSTPLAVRSLGHDDDAEGTEVRITAQRLVDGRTEFALQVREADGGWGERLLPRGRFFPAAATVGRWLSSTPLAVRSLGHDDDAEGTEVRITAQRLVDGRTEFALQVREADGGWGERLLPRGRFFPAAATVGRWLSSTPLTVSLPEVLPHTAEEGGSVASDRAALVALYNATGGASWITDTNWLSDRPLDQWHGVTTNSDGRVIWLSFSRNQLTGPIPAELGDLSSLEQLVLAHNQLTGPIPAELGALTNLESLILADIQLTGPIPAELGALTKLRSLLLLDNQLTGPIPAELGALTKLQHFGVAQNRLTGPIPAELGALTNLRMLSLWGNQLTGPIPAELRTLTNLQTLGLSDNELTGPIPAWLGALTNLGRLHLGSNRLTGSIPAELGDLTNLEDLGLGGNQLTGPIPARLGELSNLQTLGLSGNGLTGCVPAGLRAAASREVGELGLPDCGDVPPDAADDGGSVASDRAALVALYNATGGASWLASTNWLSDKPLYEWHGVITNSVGRVAQLSLGSNRLTGPIPAELGDLTKLNWLWLYDNALTGPIPAELGGLSKLEQLWLSNNQLTGPIPTWLGDLTRLKRLSLSTNQLTGPIPAELGSLSKLQTLGISGNRLTGPIPTELGSLTKLEQLWLSHNQLTGPIPSELGDLANLEWLWLSHNQLSGSIPRELRALTNLESLQLSNNELTGACRLVCEMWQRTILGNSACPIAVRPREPVAGGCRAVPVNALPGPTRGN